MPDGGSNLLARFVASAPAAIAMFDREMRYLAASRRWSAHLRVAEDLVGSSHYDVSPEIPERWREAHRRGLAGATEGCDADRFDRADGTTDWLRWELAPWVDDAGEVGGITIFVEDITARTRLEDELRRTTRRLEEGERQGLSGSWEWRDGGARRWWSLGLYRLYGRDPAEGPPAPEEVLRDQVHPSDRERVARETDGLRLEGTPAHFVFRRHPDLGPERHFEGKAERVSDADGVRVVGKLRDVTRQVQAENRARESHARLRNILDRLPGFVAVCSLDGVVVDANRALLEATGPSAEGVLGRAFADSAPVSHSPRAQALVRDALARAGRGETVRYDAEVRVAPDRPLVVDTTFAPLHDAAGRIVAAVVSGIDVTERLRAEAAMHESDERLRLAVSAARVGLWDWNLRTNEAHFSPEWKAQLGHEVGEIADDYDEWERRLHPDDRRGALDVVVACLAGPSSSYRNEFRMRHKDGSYRWILAQGSFVRDPSGAPVRLQGAHVDLTDRRAAEQELRDGRVRVAALSRQLMAAQETERRNLARELHDEIGQVLTAASISLARARENAPPAAVERLLESERVVDRAIDQVRDFALRLRPPILDDFGLVPALRWYLQAQEALGGVPIASTLRVSGVLPPEVATACYRVVQEAITNVLRHARARRVEVELDASDAEVRLRVTDDGIGFDPAGPSGAHLGLVSMRERVELLGGRFALETAPGRGTTVRARIPLDPAQA